MEAMMRKSLRNFNYAELLRLTKTVPKSDGGAFESFCETLLKNWSVDFIGFRGFYKISAEFVRRFFG
jgi:hypothetical protein